MLNPEASIHQRRDSPSNADAPKPEQTEKDFLQQLKVSNPNFLAS